MSAAIAARLNKKLKAEPRSRRSGRSFAFGLCEVVVRRQADIEIRDAKVPGRVREVSMTMLNVLQPTESEGKRLFRLARRGAL